jgi:hypothetical protein
MEGVGHPGMAMPLPSAKAAYNIVQQTSANPGLSPPKDIDLVLEPIWAQEYITTHDPLDLALPSNEAILEAMTELDRP